MDNKPKFFNPLTGGDKNKPVDETNRQQNQQNKFKEERIEIPRNPDDFKKIFGFDPREVKLLIATPCYGGLMYNNYFHSLMETMAFMSQIGIYIDIKTIANESLITRARNTCVSYFLSHEQYTHLLFIDADVSFSPDSVLKLLQAKKPVISAVYPKKNYDFTRLQELSKVDNEWYINTPAKLMDYVVNYNDTQVHIDNNCIEVKDAPTGFMLIERNTFSVLKEKFPDLVYTNDLALDMTQHKEDSFWLFFDCIKDPVDGRYLSEDYAFCRLVQQAGLKCYIEVTSKLSHTGTHVFNGDIFSTFTIVK